MPVSLKILLQFLQTKFFSIARDITLFKMKAVRQWLFAAGAVNDKKSIVDEPDVYPVHTLDRMKEYQKFVATVMYFNDALDADMINASLVKLLEIGDWKKLGGRLKKDVSTRA